MYITIKIYVYDNVIKVNILLTSLNASELAWYDVIHLVLMDTIFGLKEDNKHNELHIFRVSLFSKETIILGKTYYTYLISHYFPK